MTIARSMISKDKSVRRWRLFFFLTFIIGVFLAVFAVNLLRSTIINVAIPISIPLITGIVTFFLTKKLYKQVSNTKGIFFPLIQNIGSWGLISCYVFMAMNYYLADRELRSMIFEIKSKSSMPGSRGHRNERKPLVTIDYPGLKKELVFYYRDTEKVERAEKVNLTIRRGLFGFDILEHYDTVDN